MDTNKELVLDEAKVEKKQKNHPSTYIFSLGGVGEIGKNMYVVEHEDEIIIIDAGIKFADETLPGVNGIIPSFAYLKENANNNNIFEYPKAERLVTDKGQHFYDS